MISQREMIDMIATEASEACSQDTPAASRAGLAAGMSLDERAHREAFEWDAFSFSDDPVVRCQLRRAYRYGFMRGFSVCAAMQPNAQRERPAV